MDTLDTARLIASVQREAPFFSFEQAEHAVVVTLSALARALPRSSRYALLDAVPKGLRAKLVSGAPDARESTEPTELSLEKLCEGLRDVSPRASPSQSALDSPARALEVAQVVRGVLARQLHPETRERIVRDLPEAVALLFSPEFYAAPAAPAPHTGHGHTLADGHPPGGTHPLSEAAPGSDKPISAAPAARRQQNSVAEANPHADTKVSSGCGLTQQREHESLADGRARRS